MKCDEAQELLTEYLDDQLPEVTRRRVDNHLGRCSACRAEYSIWQESNDWIKVEKDHYATVSAPSIVDAVMARILSEEKWAIPIGKKVFTLTARMRWLSASAAVILLMICSFTLIHQSGDQGDLASGSLLPVGDTLTMVASAKAPVVSASMQTDDGTYVVEPEAQAVKAINPNDFETTSPQLLSTNEDTESSKGNHGLILSFFGILITVLSMSWLNRA
ncbi:hypothetical protein EDM56_25370 [Brevibacillus fluminis]|uniref:Anti-sigma-W factor RsiW n=1 Tax=Brevibacillus fluminis TaxID=511487 RepID=A0A3M8D1A0_9BACL|nr:zf-HC2 domain-containing protein [Brevibacillus fluminis]RNB81648.1 hypothetical protein EDM56_25370 [Brevibacillus fluminis]